MCAKFKQRADTYCHSYVSSLTCWLRFCYPTLCVWMWAIQTFCFTLLFLCLFELPRVRRCPSHCLRLLGCTKRLNTLFTFTSFFFPCEWRDSFPSRLLFCYCVIHHFFLREVVILNWILHVKRSFLVRYSFELAGETKHRMQQPLLDDASTHSVLPRRDTNKFQRGILNRRLQHEEELIFTNKKKIRKESCAKVDVQ